MLMAACNTTLSLTNHLNSTNLLLCVVDQGFMGETPAPCLQRGCSKVSSRHWLLSTKRVSRMCFKLFPDDVRINCHGHRIDLCRRVFSRCQLLGIRHVMRDWAGGSTMRCLRSRNASRTFANAGNCAQQHRAARYHLSIIRLILPICICANLWKCRTPASRRMC